MLRVLALLMACLPTLAGADAAAAWRDQAIAMQLWQAPHWHNLLHYESAGWLASDRVESQVDDAAFFLSPEGASDPRAELLATIEALFAAAVADEHAQCRFVARYSWLQQELGAAPLPRVECPLYAQWRGLIRAERAALIFPTYHLNSPSSMFGHTLLRLDPQPSPGWSEWLSFAVNFGAEVPAGDNSLFYAFKGLFGGYQGRFNVEPYYKKIKEYSQIDNRDIWEYELDLDPVETDRLVQHLWELKEIDFAYFFFDENCSYRVLELLEVARPGLDLTSGFVISAIPVDTVRAIGRSGLITRAQRRPSKAAQLRQRLAQIPAQWRAQIPRLAADPSRREAAWFVALERQHQAQLVEAAYGYLRYTQTRKARDPDAALRSFALLGAMQQLAADLPPIPAPAPALAPERAHASTRAGLGWLQRDGESYATANLRMAFHSLEEFGEGLLPGAQINLGNAVVRGNGARGIQLEQFDLVDIVSLSPRDAFFRSPSWQVRTGWERQRSGSRDALAAQVSGGIGGAWQPLPGHLSYVLATARLEANPAFAKALVPALGITAGNAFNQGRHGLRLSLSSEHFSNGADRTQLQWLHHISVNRSHAVALRAQYHWRNGLNYSELALAYHAYF